MNFSKEHKLALKIAIILFVFAILVMYVYNIYVYNFYNYNIYPSYRRWLKLWLRLWNWNFKYFIFGFLSIFIYFISYFLAKATIKPIEENNKKLREYNHNLAHEIKTPISVISSNLELLEINYDKELIKSSKEELKLMQNITDDLLLLSENNELKNKEKISFKDLLEKNKRNDLIIDIKDDFIIYWNKTLIDRLIKNLIENAIKYWSKNEKINIFLDKNLLKIKNKIENNISENELNKLFDTFYKLDNSRNSSWYWLGLSIVKKIAWLHNLKIKLSSKNMYFEVKIIK